MIFYASSRAVLQEMKYNIENGRQGEITMHFIQKTTGIALIAAVLALSGCAGDNPHVQSVEGSTYSVSQGVTLSQGQQKQANDIGSAFTRYFKNGQWSWTDQSRKWGLRGEAGGTITFTGSAADGENGKTNKYEILFNFVSDKKEQNCLFMGVRKNGKPLSAYDSVVFMNRVVNGGTLQPGDFFPKYLSAFRTLELVWSEGKTGYYLDTSTFVLKSGSRDKNPAFSVDIIPIDQKTMKEDPAVHYEFESDGTSVRYTANGGMWKSFDPHDYEHKKDGPVQVYRLCARMIKK